MEKVQSKQVQIEVIDWISEMPVQVMLSAPFRCTFVSP